MAALTDKGVSGFQAIGAEAQRLIEQLFGVKDTAKGATSDLAGIGVPVANMANVVGVATDRVREFAAGGTAGGAAVRSSFDAAAGSAGQLAESATQAGAAMTESLRDGAAAGKELELSWFTTTAAMAAAKSSSEELRDIVYDLGTVGSGAVNQVGDAFRLVDPEALKLGDAVSAATAQMAGFGQVGPSSIEGVSQAVDDVLAQFSALGSAGSGAADTLETSFDALGGSLGDGLKSTLDATVSYVDDYWTTLNDKIKAGASTTADNIFGTLNDRIKDELDAEARAS